jgi:uncharacterized protein YegP (UPF0339 family)
MASDFDIRQDSKSQYYWIMNAKNGEEIARSSESYVKKSDCIHGIRLVKDIAPDAEVWDLTGGSATKLAASAIK